jgi:4-carboxymuconolactone decarboxylase
MNVEQREVAAEIAAGPRGEVRGPFIALIHNPELARRLQKLGEHLRWQGKLPPRLKELAILVTARRWTCQHEWVMHSKLALEGGLAKEMVDAIAANREPKNLSDEEKAVYAFCHEVHATGRAGDESFREIQDRFGLDGALELIALNGYYTLMAMVLNTAGLPLPGGDDPPLQRF